jgi:hypothetical protein
MSLCKPTRLTPARLDAARRNAQRSTGPRTQAGKQRMRMNALKHGFAIWCGSSSNERLSKLVGLDARSESSAEETAAEISKVREKSENV